jgi:hypothetical protein
MRAALLIVVFVVALGSTSPALARSYYVVQNSKTHNCFVLPKTPKGKTVVLLPGSGIYKTRAEARAALVTFAVCN